MSRSFLQMHNLSWRWPSQETDLFTDLTMTLEPGWTGLVGPNGGGKTTLLRLVSGDLDIRGAGRIDAPEDRRLCRQRTDDPPPDFEDLLCLPDADAGRLVSRLGIGFDWPWRWDSLSHGERKCAQIATALWRNPDILLVDEPTNHLDGPTRDLLAGALEDYRGIGIIISHDRDLLDRLCSRCLFLDRGSAVLRPGGISAGLAEMDKEDLASRRERESALKELRRLRTESRRRSREAASADRKRSKRDLDRKDSDGRAKLDLARITGRDGRAGELKKQLDIRLERAEQRVGDATVKRRRTGGITLAGDPGRSDRLARLEAGGTDLGEIRRLDWPDLEIGPTDRIALTGPNGAGKSRLLSLLLETVSVGPERLLCIPQELTVSDGDQLINRIRSLGGDRKGELFSTVDRLGSDPVRLIGSRCPSPGETRKLMLAEGLIHRPALVVMDEPTNHMDLFSVQHLESALAGFDGAMLLVSHDRRFLEALTDREWVIRDGRVEV